MLKKIYLPFLNLPILLQFVLLYCRFSSCNENKNTPGVCKVVIKSENSSCCDIEDRDRGDAYKISTPEQHPYSVLVYCNTKSSSSIIICSGTLLSPYWVVTAGHCFRDCKKSFIYAGGNSIYELEKKNLPDGATVHEVGTVCHHRRFDIVLAKTKAKFTLTKYVNTIALPAGPLPTEVVTCNSTAFGRVVLGESVPQWDYRRKTQEIEVVWPCECYYRLWRGDNKLWNKVASGDNFVCSVPREDYGVCMGDSGSGLVYKGVLQGVSTSIFSENNIEACIFNRPSSRIGCGAGDTSSAFLAVYPLLRWIKKVLKDSNLKKLDCHNNASAVPTVTLTLIFASKGLTLSSSFFV